MKRSEEDPPIFANISEPIGDEDFRHLAEATPQLVWTSDPAGMVDYTSPQLGAFTGVDPADPTYLDWRMRIHPEDLEGMVETWERSIATGDPFTCVFRLRAADGSFQWFSGKAVPMRDKQGQIAKWYGATSNIHRIKEEELALLQEAEKTDQFITTLVHELRNPLSAISNSFQILALDGIADEMKSKAMASLGRQIDQLTSLVERTFDIPQTGRE